MCDRWKLTMAERVRKWYKSIANLPDEYKTLLREAGDDTERYQIQLDREKTLIDPISIPLCLTGKKVSEKAVVDIKLYQSQLDIWTIGDFIRVVMPYIGKRCLIRERFGLYKYSSIYLDFHGRILNKSSHKLSLSSFVRDDEMPYFYVYY